VSRLGCPVRHITPRKVGLVIIARLATLRHYLPWLRRLLSRVQEGLTRILTPKQSMDILSQVAVAPRPVREHIPRARPRTRTRTRMHAHAHTLVSHSILSQLVAPP
jgi:hypothetical protein